MQSTQGGGFRAEGPLGIFRGEADAACDPLLAGCLIGGLGQMLEVTCGSQFDRVVTFRIDAAATSQRQLSGLDNTSVC
jgi:hypothetical protein